MIQDSKKRSKEERTELQKTTVQGVIKYSFLDYRITKLHYDADKLTVIVLAEVSLDSGYYYLLRRFGFNRRSKVLFIDCRVEPRVPVEGESEPISFAQIETRTEFKLDVPSELYTPEGLKTPIDFFRLLSNQALATTRGSLQAILGICEVGMRALPIMVDTIPDGTETILIAYSDADPEA